MSANKRYSNSDYFDFFQSKISGMSSESQLRYCKTLSELDVFLVAHHLSLADLSPTMIADWTFEMLYCGFAKSTVARHLNAFSGMIKDASKKGMLDPTDFPRTLAKALSDPSDLLPLFLQGRVFNSYLGILRSALKRTEKFNVYEEIVLFSLLNGAASVENLIRLKTADTLKYNPASRFIPERNCNRKISYAFDLKQSYLTSKQLKASINKGIYDVFQPKVDEQTFDADDFIRSLWVASAIRSGISVSEATGYVGGTASFAIPSFYEPVISLSKDRQLWVNTVNSILLNDMPRWYAMHLRRGVTFEEIRKTVYEMFSPVPLFFYPCETIMKKTGNRRIMTEQPFIANTVFFKSHPENVMPLFNMIGDKAWCYRALGLPGSPYAVIRPRDMERFQSAVGVFTSDVEIKPLGGLSPKPGETVIVVRAGFGNRTGEVEEIINKDCDSAIFRIKLTTDMGYEFRIDVDERQIERIIG